MTATRRSFRPGTPLTLQVALALATVVALATWQFSRGLDKSALATERAERLRAEPVRETALSAATPDFTRIELTGSYDAEHQFFVAGRVPGRVQAWSVLHVDSGAFLVNRGWLARAGATPEEPATVVGVVWPGAQVPVFVAQEPWPDGWPKTIRAANPLRMAEAVGAQPREIRLEGGSAGVVQPASLAWDYSPGTHWGYTAQWLLIGVAVAVGYVVIGLRRGQRAPGDV